MKILQVNKLYPPHLGGIENVVRDIAETLSSDDRFQSDVLVCRAKGKRVRDNNNNITIFRAGSLGRLFSLPISLDFFFLFKKISNNYDLLLFHHPFPLASLARFIFPNKNKKMAIWYHSDIVRQKILYKLVYPFLYLDLKNADVIFVSSYRLAEKSKLLKKFLNKCKVIPFGVDLELYNNDYENEVQYLKQKYGRFMLSVGRLVYYKGYLDLIKAMKNSSGKILIIGSGPLEEKMKFFIKNNNLEDRIIITSNKVENLIPYYKACEFLVFPSSANSEAFGLVQIEAMACGKPVINTNLETGVPEVSLNNKTGITIEVGDAEGLSRAISLLWGDNNLISTFGKNAKERVLNNFNKDKFNEDLKNSLLVLLNK